MKVDYEMVDDKLSTLLDIAVIARNQATDVLLQIQKIKNDLNKEVLKKIEAK